MKKNTLIISFSLILILSIMIVAELFISFKGTYRDEVEEQVETNIQFINNYLDVKLEQSHELNFEDLVKEFSQITKCRVTILDNEGNLLGDSHIEKVKFKSFHYDTEILQAKNGDTSSNISISPITNKFTLYLAKPIVIGNQRTIIIRLGYTLDRINYLITMSLRIIIVIIIFIVLIVGFLSYSFLGNINKKIKKLVDITRYIYKGNYYNVNEIEINDEIKPLIDNFNLMAKKLQHMTQKTNERNSQISTILVNIGSGMLVVDKNNKIVMLNPQAEELINVDKRIFFKGKVNENSENKIFQEIMEITADVISSQKVQNRLLQTEDGKILEVIGEPIKNKYEPYEDFGALVIIKDVTEIKKLQNLRVEFVSNVSHELRTPLTLISGFVETLRDWDMMEPEDRLKALDIIEIETERLKRLISELLNLSAIENKLARRANETIDMELEIIEAMKSVEHMAEQKGITVISDIRSPFKSILGSKDWIRQIMINLCENAIKYSPKGSSVWVEAFCHNDQLVIKVKDNGLGIPKEDLPRIFERLYRVDKARSSKIEGTGLGLAIVKHIVIELKGDIKVDSTVGVGSEFRVTIPVVPKI